MLKPAEFEQIHQNMIAGRVPNHRGDVHLSIFMIARDIFDTDKIHMLVSISDDEEAAYYIAAPSASFASIEEFRTSLALAFPSHPGHRGDGIYLVVNGVRAALVEKAGTVFRVMVNSTSVLQDYVKSQPLDVFDVSSEPGWVIESTARTYRRVADKISRTTIKFSLLALGLCVGVSIVAAAVQVQLRASLEAAENSKVGEINGLINKVEFVSPLNRQLGRLQKIGATVVRAGGWIEEYEVRGPRESFRVSMPEWVTQDYIEVLGKDVVAERDRAENVITFTKGARQIGVAAAVASAVPLAARNAQQEKSK
jgi:hypothetical protein